MTVDEFLKSLGDLRTYHPTVINLIRKAFLEGHSVGAKEAFAMCGVM